MRNSKKHQRSILAKLLASENLEIRHGNFQTAFFDTEKRILGLPDWKNVKKEVYDMLIAHEVGHALFTPHSLICEFKDQLKGLPFDLLNVVEDIRIERKIQMSYAGLPSIFIEAYKTLLESDFFSIEGKDLNSFVFLDRLNLKGKVGKLVDIPMNEEELSIYETCFAAETDEDVLSACFLVADYIERSKKKEDPTPPEAQSELEEEEEQPCNSQEGDKEKPDEEIEKSVLPPEEMEDEDDEDYEEDFDDFFEAETPKGDVKDEDKEPEEGDLESSEDVEDPKDDYISETQGSFENKLENAADENGHITKVYPPRLSDFEKHIVSNKEFLKQWKSFKIKPRKPFMEAIGKKARTLKKVAASSAKEFNRKKSAWEYARGMESKSGTLNVNKLHSYKYEENIFSTVTRYQEAQSHGLIFFLDFSGSMAGLTERVIDNVLVLTEFCNMLSIPFDVYSFTSNGKREFGDSFPGEIGYNNIQSVHLLSSQNTKSETKELREVLQIFGRNPYMVRHNDHFKMSGTPLDALKICSKSLIEKFQKTHGIQKTHVTFLTDGDSQYTGAQGISRSRSTWEGEKLTSEGITKVLSKMPGVTTSCIYLPGSISRHKNPVEDKIREIGSDFIQRAKLLKKYNKEHYLRVENALGYDSYFILPFTKDTRESINHHAFGPVTNKKEENKLAKDYIKQSKAVRLNFSIFKDFVSAIA